jgi:hypothetical protein
MSQSSEDAWWEHYGQMFDTKTWPEGEKEEMRRAVRIANAAPVLLSALIAADREAPHGEACTPEECRCWHRYAKAAIAKAQGASAPAPTPEEG